MLKLEKNVIVELNKCSKIVGLFEEEQFNIEMFCNCMDIPIKSPIEQILYFSMRAIQRLNYIEPLEPKEINGKTHLVGFGIEPQFKIGNYCVDFLLVYFKRSEANTPKKQLVVECDSQEFHDRSEEERRYEKKRDRFLQLKGYKVFRYTGKEIIQKPIVIAAEIISYVTNIKKEYLVEEIC